MNAPPGSLLRVRTTEETELYAYRPARHLARGLFYAGVSLALIAGAIVAGVTVSRWYAWLIGVVPLLASAVAATWGVVDLLNRPLFQLEVNRRARTLALAMATEHGQALAKVGFDDMVSIEIAEKSEPTRSWNVMIHLKNGRRIGLGLSDDPAKAEEVAARFSSLIGVGITRTS